jgi:hypothetical protein
MGIDGYYEYSVAGVLGNCKGFGVEMWWIGKDEYEVSGGCS